MPELVGEEWRVVPLSSADVEDSYSDVKGLGVINRRRDSSDNLFEILPQSFIKREDDNPIGGQVRVLSTSFGEIVGLVLDNELIIMEDLEGEARRLKFQATIDFILWRRSILLVGLNSSEIVLVDPNTFQIRECKQLSKNASTVGSRFFVSASIHSNPDPSKIDVTAIGRDGTCYCFHNISLSDGSLDATTDQNVSVDIDVGSVKGTKIKCLDDGAKVLSATCPTRNIIILGEEDGTLSKLDLEEVAGERKPLSINQSLDLTRYLGYGSEVQIQKIVNFEDFFYVLLSNGRLEILLKDLLIPTEPLKLPNPSWIVYDFLPVLSADAESKVWVLFGTPDLSQKFVGIFEGPSLTEEFIIKIPTLSRATNPLKFMFPTQATFLEEPGVFLEISRAGVTIYKMLETSTEASIQKLLGRGKFDQALELSEKFGKDLDIVYKAKVKATFNELVVATTNADTIFNELVQTLERVRDAVFICDFCVQNGFAKLAWVKQILNIARTRVKDCGTTKSGKTLLLTLKKFYTFEQVFPSAGIKDWLFFISEANSMFQQCKLFLNNHEFLKCEKVWRRHYDEFIFTLKLDDFGPFFFVLFGQKLKSPTGLSLFKCILPFAVEKCAETQETAGGDSILNHAQLAKVAILVNIVKRQVSSLEREKLWPQEAIEFSKAVIEVVKNTKEELGDGRVTPRCKTETQICSEILLLMDDVVTNLNELGDLKKNHSIRISFQQYLDNDVIEVVNSMLCELFLRPEIETFISSFLVSFARRKGLSVDNLFYEHVKAVVGDIPFHINTIDIPQEERVICLISHISSIKTKLHCILSVAEEWPVPWSQNIDNLILGSLSTVPTDEDSSQLLKTIKILRIQVPFRCLLNKYKLFASKVQMQSGVVMAVNRILRKGKPEEAFADCMELIKHTGMVDEAKVRVLEFGMKLRDGVVPVEDLVNSSWDKSLLKKMLFRILQSFKMGPLEKTFNEEEIKRMVDTGKMLANLVDDRKATEFFKLREILPRLADPDIVYDDTYPFVILNHIMPDYATKPFPVLMSTLNKMCKITFTHLPDVLAAAAAYYPSHQMSLSTKLAYMLSFVEHLVAIPGCVLGRYTRIIDNPALTVAQFILINAADISEANLELLHDFLTILIDCDESCDPVSKSLAYVRIFISLRDQEIPTEREFQNIYKWLYLQGIPSPNHLYEAMQSIGTRVLQFGDKNLFRQMFSCVINELAGRAVTMPDHTHRAAVQEIQTNLKAIQVDLLTNCESMHVLETDRKVLELVTLLEKEADIVLTPYALRERNKPRFLQKLISFSRFSLAAQVAITFEEFSDMDIWSQILKGFMSSAPSNIAPLKKVLFDLRNVSELWMLPEFAEGWKMVAAQDEKFLDLCPIPLDD